MGRMEETLGPSLLLASSRLRASSYEAATPAPAAPGDAFPPPMQLNTMTGPGGFAGGALDFLG